MEVMVRRIRQVHPTTLLDSSPLVVASDQPFVAASRRLLLRLGQAVVAADGKERNKPTNPEIRSSEGPPAHRAFKDGNAPANSGGCLP